MPVKTVLTAWGKWLRDLSGTRQQITLVVILLWAWIVLRGIRHIASAQDAVGLLQAITPVVIATVGAWFGGKWLMENYHRDDR